MPIPNHTGGKRLTPSASCQQLDYSYSENNYIDSNRECYSGQAAVYGDGPIEDYAANPEDYVADRKLTLCSFFMVL